MTTVIAISNEKGGVAKTTTAVSLGGAFVEMGQDVLLVDLDPQANLSLGLGLTPQNIRRSTSDILLNMAAPLSVSRETSIPGLDLIPANSEMGMAERFLPIRQNYKFVLRRALSSIPLYDTIILDCPPSMGVVTINALVAADLLIIPTQTEYFSTHALKNVMNMVRTVRTNENPDLDIKLLITMFDIRIGSHKTLARQLKNTFGSILLDTIIQIDTKFRESTIVGLPITHYVPRSRGAVQYRTLAEELTRNVSKEKLTKSAR
jgi:chromosome partitioning protein